MCQEGSCEIFTCLHASKNKPISKFMNEKCMYLRTFRIRQNCLKYFGKQEFSNGRHDHSKENDIYEMCNA